MGAGLTGLVAAYELHRHGVPCVVLEAGAGAGGRVATVRFPDGAIAESGMEEFWDTSPAHGLLRHLDLPLLVQPAHSSVVIDGRLHPYGAGGVGAYLSDLFGEAERRAFSRWNDVAYGVLDELAMATQTGRWSDRLAALQRPSFASFVEQLGLPARVRAWIRMVVESEIAVEWDRIGALDGIDEMRPFLVGRPVARRQLQRPCRRRQRAAHRGAGGGATRRHHPLQGERGPHRRSGRDGRHRGVLRRRAWTRSGRAGAPRRAHGAAVVTGPRATSSPDSMQRRVLRCRRPRPAVT